MNSEKSTMIKPAEGYPHYILKLNDHVIWEGKDLKRQLVRIKKEHIGGKLSIAWKTDREFLIV